MGGGGVGQKRESKFLANALKKNGKRQIGRKNSPQYFMSHAA